MKNPAQLVMMMILAGALSACGGDKPAPAQDKPKPETVQEKASTPEVASQTQSASTPEEASKPQATSAVSAASVQESKKEEIASAASAAPVQALSIEEGKKLYDKTCKVCHEQGLLEAPKLTDKANWAKRLEKGVDTLHQHSAKGFNKMPPQATGDVSEAQVYAAVDYMVSQAK